MKNRIFIWFLFAPLITLGQQPQESDSAAIADILKGSWVAEARYQFMHTVNHGSFSDPWAQAAALSLHYSTGRWKGFQFNAAASLTAKLGSGSVFQPDPYTQLPNRYEAGLFDLQHPQRDLLPRLEELNINFRKNNLEFRLGKQSLNTPFFNPQDGRMRPNFADAAWLHAKTGKLQIESGWIYGVAPRSTTGWFSPGASIGIYPQGVNEKGEKNNYAQHLSANGMGMLGLKLPLPSRFSTEVWYLHVPDIFHMGLLRLHYVADNTFYVSVQGLRQDALQFGGHPDPSRTYLSRGEGTFAISLRGGFRTEKKDLNFNYTRITGEGRFLLPREWGREPLYTFMQRERNEGVGDLHALSMNGLVQAGKKWKLAAGAGWFSLPPVDNFRLNKYGMPSYVQINTSFQYQYNSHLRAELLLVHKQPATGEDLEPRYRFNKVNMTLIHLMLHYHSGK